MWEIVASAALSSLLGGKSNKARYTPNPTWSKLQETLMTDINKGLESGGYTWDDVTNEQLKRSAVESAATPYRGAESRVMGSLAPYGNVGAAGRGLVSLNTARAMDESTALRNVDIQREQQKINSQQQLMGLAAGVRDPNLPQADINAMNSQIPSASQNFGSALATGVGTYMNLNQAQQNQDFWNQYLNKPMGLLKSNTTSTPSIYGRYLKGGSSQT